MRTLITTLIIASFIQVTILPVNLVLIILICRSYLKADRANLFLAFGFGLLDAHLNLTPLGLTSLIYLTLVQITQSLSKLRLAGNPVLIIPLSLILIWADQLAISLFTQRAFQISGKIFWESLISLPVYYLIRLWEERFIVRKEIKLKV